MSAQAVAEAWLRLEEPPEVDWRATGNWLLARNNAEVTNQMAAACLALERLARITGDERYSDGAFEKFAAIEKGQLESGCYGEYGGADVGYATITLALLAQYHRLTSENVVIQSMRRCDAFLVERVNQQGLFDWQDTSRRTQFLYPSGLAYLKSPVLDRLTTGLNLNIVIDPLWMDDRYCIPLATDYLLAVEHLKERDHN